jgi:hypothetical protein
MIGNRRLSIKRSFDNRFWHKSLQALEPHPYLDLRVGSRLRDMEQVFDCSGCDSLSHSKFNAVFVDLFGLDILDVGQCNLRICRLPGAYRSSGGHVLHKDF